MARSWIRICTFLGLWNVARGNSSGEPESSSVVRNITPSQIDYPLASRNSQDSRTRLRTIPGEFPSSHIRNYSVSATVFGGFGKSEFEDFGSVGNPEVKIAEDELVEMNAVKVANGKNISGMIRRVVKSDDSECTAIYSCLDCFTARLCRPNGDDGFEEVLTVKCPPSAPHCDPETGTCMYREDPICMEPDDFVCLSDGHFPDVSCKFYHVCTNLTAQKHQCEEENENYNAERGSCDVQTEQCGVFDCYQQTAGVKTPYTTAPNYFAYCGGDKRPIFIDKCPDGTWLNTTTQRCEPMCFQQEGLIQDPADCTKYYKCHKLWLTQSSWTMIKERKSCPPGTGFSPEEFSCVSPPTCQPNHRIEVRSN